MATVVTPTVRNALNTMRQKVTAVGKDLQAEIKEALTNAHGSNDLDPMQMLDLQFKMGQFNAMVEATSSVTKGLTDTAKTLAQRAGG